MQTIDILPLVHEEPQEVPHLLYLRQIGLTYVSRYNLYSLRRENQTLALTKQFGNNHLTTISYEHVKMKRVREEI